MSTKTSIKRIALVAAAALTLGGFSVITVSSANAYVPTVKYTTMYDTTNGYQVVGGQATVTIDFDTTTIATVVSSGVGSVVSASPKTDWVGFETLTAVSAAGFQHNKVDTVYGAGGPAYDSVTVVLTSLVAGVQTLTITPLDNTTAAPGTPITKTITWTAAGTTSAASWSAYVTDSTTGYGAKPVDSTIPLSYDKGSATVPAQVALLAGQLKDANGNGVSGATVSVTVAGPGLINAIQGSSTGTGAPSSSPGARVQSVTTTAGGWVLVSLSGDGSAGVSTVTFTSGTVTASKSVTFTGSVSKYTLTSQTGAYAVGANGYDDTATGNTGGIKVVATDSAGGKAVTGTFYAKSSNKAVATVSSAGHSLATVSGSAAAGGLVAGTAYIAVTGVAVGKATITIQNTDPAGTTAPTVSQTIDIVVTAGKADSVAFTTDKATYSPGEPGTLNITLKNADGTPVADGSYNIFAALTPLVSNLYVTGNSTGANYAWSSGLTTVSTVGGVASYDFYAPSVSSGTLTFTATTLAATTASSALSSAARGLPLTATAAISGGGDNSSLALDAANAATDAANNAYDEAQNATQAASDALAAVKALAVQVKALIALVTKIKNKVGA